MVKLLLPMMQAAWAQQIVIRFVSLNQTVTGRN